MKINVQIEAHAFAGEALCDEYFDTGPQFALAGPDEMGPLSRWRNKTIVVDYIETSTVDEIRSKIEERIWEEPGKRARFFSFVADHERYFIIDPNASFVTLLSKYLDRKFTNQITVCFLVSYDAGGADPKNGPLRYYFHSHEGERHLPHVHVRDLNYEFEASISLTDGRVLAGKLPRKLEKMAKKQILANQKYYFDCWNTMTDGLRIDVDHHFGIIRY